jgi:hypothetical protein
MRWLFVVLVAALIVSVSWWKIHTRASDAPLAVDIAAQDGGADQVAMQSHPQHTGVAGNAGIPGVSEPIRARREREQANQAQAVAAGRNKLVSQYQNEKVNGGWAAAREQSLTSNAVSPQIEQLGAKPKNLTAHCRSTTCQITADFPTPTAADDWVTLYLTDPATALSKSSYQTSENPDGSVHIDLYGQSAK